MKLPVLSVVVAAYQILFANLRTYARLAWFPFFVGILGRIVGDIYLPSLETSERQLVLVIRIGITLLALLATIPAITAWHRLVVLGADDPQARIRYTIGRTERAYLWKAFLLYVAALFAFSVVLMAITMAAGTSIADLGSPEEVGQVVAIVAWLVGILVTTGFMLTLPAAAIGRDLSLRDSLVAARGNVVRLFGAYLLAGAPEYTLLEVLSVVYPSETDTPLMPSAVGYVVLETIIVFGFFTITVSVLSVTYRLLVFSNSPTGDAAPG